MRVMSKLTAALVLPMVVLTGCGGGGGGGGDGPSATKITSANATTIAASADYALGLVDLASLWAPVSMGVETTADGDAPKLAGRNIVEIAKTRANKIMSQASIPATLPVGATVLDSGPCTGGGTWTVTADGAYDDFATYQTAGSSLTFTETNCSWDELDSMISSGSFRMTWNAPEDSTSHNITFAFIAYKITTGSDSLAFNGAITSTWNATQTGETSTMEIPGSFTMTMKLDGQTFSFAMSAVSTSETWTSSTGQRSTTFNATFSATGPGENFNLKISTPSPIVTDTVDNILSGSMKIDADGILLITYNGDGTATLAVDADENTIYEWSNTVSLFEIQG